MAALIKAPLLMEGAIDLLPVRSNEAPVKGGLERGIPHKSSVPPRGSVPEQQSAAPPVEPAAQENKLSSAIGPRPGPAPDTLPVEDRKAKEALLAQARKDAAAEGYESGLMEGREVGARELAEVTDALRQVLVSGRSGVVAMLEESESLIAPVVFESVCKIVGRELVSPEACASVVKAVLARVSRDEVVTVRVSPEDCAVMTGAAEPLADLEGIVVEADESIDMGGCIVALKAGSIDGRIETQFRLFAQSLKDAARRK